MENTAPTEDRPGPTTVAMDTSALMMPVECDLRVFEELDRVLDGYEPIAPVAVLEELERLSTGDGAEGTAASVGYELADERCRVVETEAGYADDALVEFARDGVADYVVTNDQPLADRINDEGVPVIGLRARNKLAVTRP
jgi:rRNA-processing protein FCF1